MAAGESFKDNTVGSFVLSRWDIAMVGDKPDRAETRDTVYQIKGCYARDISDADFRSWIAHYGGWFLFKRGPVHDPDAVAVEIPCYISSVVQDGYADRAFLKAETFRLRNGACWDPGIGEDVRHCPWASSNTRSDNAS